MSEIQTPSVSRNPGVHIRFDPVLHSYEIADEGRKYIKVPSVTEIIRPLRDFGDIPPNVLAQAKERGTAVHRAIDIIEGGGDGSGLHPSVYDSPLGGYIRAYQKFADPRHKATPHHKDGNVEVANLTLGYAGTLDQLRCDPTLGYWQVWEFKTGKYDPSDRVQVTAYARALLESHILNPFKAIKGVIIYLKPDGSWETVDVIIEQEKHSYYWQVFLSCLTVKNWRGAHGNRDR